MMEISWKQYIFETVLRNPTKKKKRAAQFITEICGKEDLHLEIPRVCVPRIEWNRSNPNVQFLSFFRARDMPDRSGIVPK